MLRRIPPQARTTTSWPSPTVTVSSRGPTPSMLAISSCILPEAIDMTRPILVGIAGGSGSGKTTVAEKIMHETAQPVVFLKQDSYYRNFDGMSIEEKRRINYDHPSAYDDDLLIDHLQRLIRGEAVDVPVYSYARYEREPWTCLLYTSPSPRD